MSFLSKKTAISLVLTLCILFGAWSCNPANWLPRVNAILSELGPAVAIVANLLPLLGVSVPASVNDSVNTWVPRVQDDLSQLSAELQKAQNDLSTNSGAQAKVNALVQTTQQDIVGILPVFRVFDPTTQQRVKNVVNGLSAGVVSVENIINIAEGKVTMKAAPGGARMSASGKEFKHNFNGVLKTNFPKAKGL